MKILSPDKFVVSTEMYFFSCKLLIPGVILTRVLNVYEHDTGIFNLLRISVDIANVLNFGYNSYFSVSSLISEHVRGNIIPYVCRCSSVFSHTLIIYELSRYLCVDDNKNKN